ncbi:uncharacterized protein A1O9_08833 [Exophiala aquamarina CBS 119918]|uniref:N-acetyltransferase domain-containing protein n=1 Tax=Exophiala aquamarina CBS 119918 TaxID=1182545 RepID=A0A072P4Y8_9EURO|nr:uncharacterized protein A1O9_08833 [Exophiala aquamarina CBS 119918]KEF55179.1 hypothetical protein A1O9_08833 [Exophiala aquamarina CBS 119918]
MPVIVRPATESDLHQVRDIFEHYVLNTVVSFLTQKPSLDYIATRYRDSMSRQLPYLVAVDESQDGKVVGYACSSAFRGYMLGYGHTVEITLICHPQYTGRGIGSLLISQLVTNLKNATHLCKEVGYEDTQVEFKVRKVMAIMAIDETAANRGLTLRDWYQKWGFEEVGRLKGVGSKMGRT